MIPRNSAILLVNMTVAFSLGATACEPAIQKQNDVAVIKTENSLTFVFTGGCVASGWSREYGSHPDRILKWAEKHISGEISPSQINTELMTAIVRNQPKTVADLLANTVDIEETNTRGCTALIWASALGREDMVAMLLEKGVDVSRADGTGKTPLMFASMAANARIVKKLVDHGASVDSAQTGGHSEVGRTALHLAANQSGNSEVLKILIEEGANVDAVDEHGITALINAVDSGNIENVRALTEAGAKIKLKSNDGSTAMDHAIRMKRSEIITYLKNQ